MFDFGFSSFILSVSPVKDGHDEKRLQEEHFEVANIPSSLVLEEPEGNGTVDI